MINFWSESDDVTSAVKSPGAGISIVKVDAENTKPCKEYKKKISDIMKEAKSNTNIS